MPCAKEVLDVSESKRGCILGHYEDGQNMRKIAQNFEILFSAVYKVIVQFNRKRNESPSPKTDQTGHSDRSFFFAKRRVQDL